MSAQAAGPYRIRHSQRAKRLRVVVKLTGVEVVIPAGMSEAHAQAFVRSQQRWIEQKLAELQLRQAARSFAEKQEWRDGATLPFRGRELPLSITERPGARVRVDVDDSFRIALPAIPPEQSARRVEAAVFAWIRAWLVQEAAAIAARHSARNTLCPRELRVKRMRTRWGSCGPRNDVNLNWLLAFTPPDVLEYVVVHELCHIRHRNHSAQFWGLVGEHLPVYACSRDWLRRHGGALLERFP